MMLLFYLEDNAKVESVNEDRAMFSGSCLLWLYFIDIAKMDISEEEEHRGVSKS